MQHSYHRYNAETFIIHIDSFEKGILSGQFCRPSQGRVWKFESLLQLLVAMEQCLEESNEPQAFTAMRSFWAKEMPQEEENEQVFLGNGKVASFTVQIMFRRNTSWQGTVTWMEEGEKRNFRSVQELIFLLNSALSVKQSCLQYSYPLQQIPV